MEDWYTVRQAAHSLDVSMSRVYALIAAGTLASKKQGLTTMVSRRSVETYKDSPNRNKFASGGRREEVDVETPSLFGSEISAAEKGEAEYRGCNAPMLSETARRLYDRDVVAGRWPMATGHVGREGGV